MPVIVIAAMTAILFWSLKPVFVATIGDRATFAEIFVIAGAIALACSLAGAAIMWRDTLKLVRTRAVFYGAANAVTAGFFLALWYYGFYRGLYNSQKADVTIIAFTWPLIAIFAMQIFAPNLARRLSRMELSLVLVAFFGAVAIGLGRLTSLDLTSNSEILFAFLAAFGSGVYLPFSLKALIAFEDIIGSKVKATFFSVSLANAAALAFVLCYFAAMGQRLYFYAFDPTVWAICALIGIGTYLLAEMTWNWAFTEFKSLTLSSLVYFSPALSVVYLYVFFDVPVSSLSVFGLVLILFANMTLHGRYQLNNALFSALIGTLFVALCSFFVVPTDTRFLTDLLYFLSGVFAILAGFILSRVSGRRAQEVDVRSDLVRSLLELRNGEQVRDDMIDTLLQLLIEIEFTAILAEKQESAVAFRTGLRQIEPSERLRQTRANFDQWYNIHRDRLSLGEKAAIWLTGGGSILFLVLVRGDDVLSQIGVFILSAGILLVLFTISDYEKSNVQGFRKQFLRLQEGFSELGRTLFVPRSVVETREISSLDGIDTLRFRNLSGDIETISTGRDRSGFRIVYSGTALLMLGALFALPLSSSDYSGNQLDRIIRPGVGNTALQLPFFSDESDIVIASFAWDASKVIAEVIRQTISDRLGYSAAVQEANLNDVFAAMADPNGRIDVHPDFWLQNQPENLIRYVRNEGSVSLNAQSYEGTQGIYVAAPFAEGVTQISDLASAAVSAQYDTNGNGRGEIWIGAGDWLSTAIVRQHLERFGLDQFWDFEVYGESIFRAKLASFQARGESLVFYGYEPDWVHAIYDTIELDSVCPGDEPNGGGDCELASVDVHVAYSAALEDDMPSVSQLLSRIRFRAQDLNAWLSATAQSGEAPEAVAAQWIAEHETIVQGWLEGS